TTPPRIELRLTLHDCGPPAAVQRRVHSRKIRALAARDDFAVRDGSSIRALRDALLLSRCAGRAHGGGWEGADPADGGECRVSGVLGSFDSREASRAEGMSASRFCPGGLRAGSGFGG